MKLKYLVETEDKHLFANSIDNLASYFKLTLAGMRYRIKNKLTEVKKIDLKLQDLEFDYNIDKNGIVSVGKSDPKS